jgi:uncharacterized membrane protein
MKLKISQPVWQVVALGVLAGMRTSSAPAITSHILSHHQQTKCFSNSSLGFMRLDQVATALKVFAVSELIADKLPSTPNRIKPFALFARCLSGGLAGASIYKATGNDPLTGIFIGTTAAFASTFGSYFLRKSIVRQTRIMDPVIGAIEDALVIGASVSLAENT